MGTIGTPLTGGINSYQIIARVNSSVSVTATKNSDGTVKTFTEENGLALIYGLSQGVWTIRIEKGNHSIERVYAIANGQDCIITPFYFYMVPNFHYTGDFEIWGYDSSRPSQGQITNWRIKFLTSGTLTFYDLWGQLIDLFIVGGGGDAYIGCGGGGGYTKTFFNITAEEGKSYYISVGGSNGNSTFSYENSSGGTDTYTAKAGEVGRRPDNNNIYGGNGGCGGGGCGWGSWEPGTGSWNTKAGNGGSNGSNGTAGETGYTGVPGLEQYYFSHGGTGQGTTTREFQELGWEAYSPGGAGGYGGSQSSSLDGENGSGWNKLYTNSGAGGSSKGGCTAKGFSGIVVIRNSKDQYGFTVGTT